MDKFQIVETEVTNAGCKLLMTKEEFEKALSEAKKNSHQYIRISFTGICGHSSSAVFTNFKTRRTGLNCKDCVKQKSSELMLRKGNSGNSCESKGIELLFSLISEKFEYKKTKEGCLADVIIRPKDLQEDVWTPIQIKTTEKLSHRMYSFRQIKDSYKDMIIICICLSEKKLWIIPYNELTFTKSINTLNISSRSKYNKYIINNDIIDNLMKNIKQCKICSLEEAMTPISDLQKREQEYARIREDLIPFLPYSTMDIAQSQTDFMVGCKKVQEKVGGIFKNKLHYGLAVNNGKKSNRCRNFRTYRLGENNYYWFHSSIDTRFWIIPEHELLRNKYISNTSETLKSTNLYIGADKAKNYGTVEWIREYEFDYKHISSIDKERICKFFDV